MQTITFFYTGCGFVGRNLLSYLISNDLVSYVRIVDKVPPQVAWLCPEHQVFYNDAKVEFKSANLINAGKFPNTQTNIRPNWAFFLLESCKNAFIPLEGDAGWDFVVNCASETKLGQTDPVYNEGIFKLSVNCAKEAAANRIKHYVELSSGQMFSSDKQKHKESDSTEPWTFMSKWKLKV